MGKSKFKIALLSGLLLSLCNVGAQVGTWKTYRAYHNASIVAETPNLVFGVYEGSLLSYNPEDEEIRTYSIQNGLSDTDIRKMVYHPEAKALLIVYENANIDLFYGENNVYNIPFIKNESSIPNKTVNNLEISGDFAYVSTDFGIVEINVKRKEIRGTYLSGLTIRSVCRNGDYLYAATQDGIKRALISTNLLDKENWKTVDQASDISKMLFFKNNLFLLTTWNGLFYIDTNDAVGWFGLENIRSIKILNEQLIILTTAAIHFYSDMTISTQVPLSAYSIDCINSRNLYWIAPGEAGLTGFTKLPNSTEYNLTISGLKVNSPKKNMGFFMTFAANKLLVTAGGKDANRQNIDGTLMVFEDGKWFNFDHKAIAEKTGLPCLDFVSVAVDPTDPMHYFVGSWGEGLYEFKNNEFANLYSTENSSLQTAVPGSNRFIRVDGLAFDKNNNLYLVNADVGNGLSIYSNKKEWKNFYYPPLATSNPDRILVSSANQIWFNFYRGATAGIMVLDENGTVGDPSDDKVAYSGQFSDQQGNNIKATVYLAMAEDKNGLIWVGTDNGPVYFTSMDQVNRGVCNRIILADQYEEGYHLLDGIRITSIAVDGGNRKWMGSAGSGLFIIDQSNGMKTTIENFTTGNSLLLSNTINSIAINNQTGEVFIGTDKGICSYRSEATEGKMDYSEVLAYPNPVRPANSSRVTITGLVQNSTIKITDLSGNLIQEGISMGGQYTWNCADRTGAIVKAGIYLVFAATPDGKQGIATKITVIK